MGLYDEAAASRAGGRGNYLRSGRYTLLVTKVHEIDSRGKPRGGLSVVAEFVVLECESLGECEVSPDGKTVTDKPVVPNPRGSSVSYVMSDKGPGAVMQPINLKSMVFGILQGRGATEAQITSAVLQGATGAKNPLRGYRVHCETVRTQTKESKRWIDAPQWKGIPQTAEEIAAAREMLDKLGTVQAAPATTATPPATAQPTAVPPREPDPTPAADGKSFLDLL